MVCVSWSIGLAHRTMPLAIAVVTTLSGNKWYGNLKSYVKMKYKHVNGNRNKLICALANCILGNGKSGKDLVGGIVLRDKI